MLRQELLAHVFLDKAPPSEQSTAHTQFQSIAFAYAILSDPRRRKRYDTTGSTAESLDIEGDDFNWTDFFRAQWDDAITTDKINELKSEYVESESETKDLLAAYEKGKGDMEVVFEEVMFSSVLDDENRFRSIIDKAIAGKDVQPYDAYTKESASVREKLHAAAKREAAEAEEYAKELGIHDQLFGSGKAQKGRKKNSKKEDDEAGLAALIQQKQQNRASNFLENLEAKYTQPKRGKKRSAKEEPDEEEFQKTADRMKKRRGGRKVVETAEQAEQDDEDDEGLDDEDEEEETKPAPKKAAKEPKKKKKGTAIRKPKVARR